MLQQLEFHWRLYVPGSSRELSQLAASDLSSFRFARTKSLASELPLIYAKHSPLLLCSWSWWASQQIATEAEAAAANRAGRSRVMARRLPFYTQANLSIKYSISTVMTHAKRRYHRWQRWPRKMATRRWTKKKRERERKRKGNQKGEVDEQRRRTHADTPSMQRHLLFISSVKLKRVWFAFGRRPACLPATTVDCMLCFFLPDSIPTDRELSDQDGMLCLRACSL